MKRLALLLALFASAQARADVLHEGNMTGNLPEYRVADPAAAAVTAANLAESERFWPYQTALAKPWQSLARGSLGVLIRVEASGAARVDFGRDGLQLVPVGATDLVERANAIRLGRAQKEAPNFVYAIGPRLLDPTSAEARAFPFEDTAASHVFLCVFADPWRREFGALVTGLAPLRERPGVLTILFPQSRRPDSQVSGQLRAMQWKPPFVYQHLSEPYTRTLLDSGTPLPAVLLQTADGRVLYEGRFTSDVTAKLSAALVRFGVSSAEIRGGAHRE